MSIHSPPFLHAPHVRIALDAGKDVLCDKPFALGAPVRDFNPSQAERRHRAQIDRDLQLRSATPCVDAQQFNPRRPGGDQYVHIFQRLAESSRRDCVAGTHQRAGDATRGWQPALDQAKQIAANTLLVVVPQSDLWPPISTASEPL